MQIPAQRWYKALTIRHSRRKYNNQPLAPDTVTHLQNFCADWSGHFPGVRLVLVTEKPDAVFKGLIGSYGKITGAPAYVAFIGDTTDPHVHENVGYVGEAFVLEATALELGTCWIAGTFKKEAVAQQINLAANERVYCITPVGNCAEMQNYEGKSLSGSPQGHKRKPLASLCLNFDPQTCPEWMRLAFEAARIAPSAINRQPWRFSVSNTGIVVSTAKSFLEFGIDKRLDCGIAMLHLEVATLSHGAQGTWEGLSAPHVARFNLA